jgi:hypothetical protein
METYFREHREMCKFRYKPLLYRAQLEELFTGLSATDASATSIEEVVAQQEEIQEDWMINPEPVAIDEASTAAAAAAEEEEEVDGSLSSDEAPTSGQASAHEEVLATPSQAGPRRGHKAGTRGFRADLQGR